MAFASLKSGSVYYEVLGSGITIVLTSGGLAPAGTMRPLAEKLESDYKVLLWDRAGQGQSDVVFEGDSELDIFADQLAGLLDELGLDKVYVAGPSEGSRISVRFALRYPERAKGVFLWQASAGAVAEVVREIYHEQFVRFAEREGMEAVATSDYYLERIKSNPRNYSLIRGTSSEDFIAVKRKWQEELREDDPIIGHTRDELAALHVPLRVVAGLDDAHPRSSSEQLVDAVADSELVEAPYSVAQWREVQVSPTLYLYALLPGVDEALGGFIDACEI